MPRSDKARQKAREKKIAKARQKKQTKPRSSATSTRAGIRRAAGWPLYECLVSSAWRTQPALVELVVARQSPGGSIAAAAFLIDLGCLGIKDAYGTLFDTIVAYREFVTRLSTLMPLEATDLDLAAKIVEQAVAYADTLGFKPHRGYADVAAFLDGADPAASPAVIPLGLDGKPFYMSGPYDNVPRILAQLQRAVGAGNFHYFVGGPGSVVEDDDWS